MVSLETKLKSPTHNTNQSRSYPIPSNSIQSINQSNKQTINQHTHTHFGRAFFFGVSLGFRPCPRLWASLGFFGPSDSEDLGPMPAGHNFLLPGGLAPPKGGGGTFDTGGGGGVAYFLR